MSSEKENFGVNPERFEEMVRLEAAELGLKRTPEATYRAEDGLFYFTKRYSTFDILSVDTPAQELSRQFFRMVGGGESSAYGTHLFLASRRLLGSGVLVQEYGDASGDISGFTTSFYTQLFAEDDPLAVRVLERIRRSPDPKSAISHERGLLAAKESGVYGKVMAYEDAIREDAFKKLNFWEYKK